MPRNPLSRFRSRPHTAARGREGEDEAVRWLRRHGYRVLHRNVRTKAGEIDVVARDGDTLAFVEIKARSTGRYGGALAAVGPAKQQRLVRAARLWLARHPTRRPCRFDVLALDAAEADTGDAAAGEGEAWEFTLVRNAFRAE